MKSSKAVFAALFTTLAFAAQAESPDARGQFATQASSVQTRAEVRADAVRAVGDRHLDTDGSTVHAVTPGTTDRGTVSALAVQAARAGTTAHGEIYGG